MERWQESRKLDLQALFQCGNQAPMIPVPLAELRKYYRRTTQLETLVTARPDGTCFLRFVFQKGREHWYYDSETFSAANDAEATAIAESLQYQVLNGDLLSTLETASEVTAARMALENKIGQLLEGVAEGTPDVVINRKVGFAKDTMQPLLFFWTVPQLNTYRPRYEPELTELMDAVNMCLDAAHPDWRTPPKSEFLEVPQTFNSVAGSLSTKERKALTDSMWAGATHILDDVSGQRVYILPDNERTNTDPLFYVGFLGSKRDGIPTQHYMISAPNDRIAVERADALYEQQPRRRKGSSVQVMVGRPPKGKH